MSTKQAVRKSVAAALRKLDQEQLALQGERCARALRSLNEYRRAEKIAFYMHMNGGELPTSRMIANAFEDNKRVFLPNIVRYRTEEHHEWYADQRTHLRMLEMPTLASVDALQPQGKLKLKEPLDGFNCLEPGNDGRVVGLDMIILPGVAFTKEGARLGHGAGFYDSFISEHEAVAKSTPVLFGVGLLDQLLESIPMEEHDRLLDGIIVDGQVYSRDVII